jgi:hypothetical protein
VTQAPGSQPVYVAAPQPVSSWRGCTQQEAAVRLPAITLQAANDPCLVHWRSIEVQKHPERAMELECMGLKAYEDPQPPGHPMPLTECDRITREDQQRLDLPVRGLSEERKALYRTTWGN